MFEKKNGKRFLASVMALVMLLSLAPVGALAVEDEAQNQDVVTLPADEVDPKPVVTDEENTENTNEELTPPPRNEGDTVTPVDNNDASTAISETLVILNPVDLLNQASDYTTELTWFQPSTTQEATFFYLKTPTSIPGSNETEDWGSALGNGTVNTSDLHWTETNLDGSYGHNVENSFNVTNSMISMWPSTNGTYSADKGGYVLSKETSHWNAIFGAYKEDIRQKLGVEELNSSDVTDIILTPFKVSRYNKVTNDKHYHVDCTVEVKCDNFATATFKLWNDETRTYKSYSAANYRKGTSVVFPKVETKPEYTFSGWYLDEDLTGSALNEHTIQKNVTFYAKCTPKTYTVTWKNGSTLLEKDKDVAHNTQPSYRGATPTKEGNDQYNYKFIGWSEDADATTGVAVEELSAVTKDVTYYAVFGKVAKTYTVIFDANGGAWAENVTIPDYNINEGTRDKATRENLTASDTIKSISYPTKNGATMIGWGIQGGQPLYQLGLGRGVAVSNLKSLNGVSVTGNTITLYAIWQNVSADQCTYTIHQHFMKDASHEDGAINYYTTSQVASAGTLISNVIPDSLINKNTRYKFGYSEYLYGEAKIGTTPYKGTETLQANNTAIHLYYYLDEVGETSKENPDGGPDGIPDAWQYKVTFKVANGKWNNETKADIVKYVTKKDDTGEASATRRP